MATARSPTRPTLSGGTVTGIKVVDASALAALPFGEPGAEAIAGRLEGARLAAPALLDFELANVCLTKMRRQPSQRDALRAAFRLAHRRSGNRRRGSRGDSGPCRGNGSHRL